MHASIVFYSKLSNSKTVIAPYFKSETFRTTKFECQIFEIRKINESVIAVTTRDRVGRRGRLKGKITLRKKKTTNFFLFHVYHNKRTNSRRIHGFWPLSKRYAKRLDSHSSHKAQRKPQHAALIPSWHSSRTGTNGLKTPTKD